MFLVKSLNGLFMLIIFVILLFLSANTSLNSENICSFHGQKNNFDYRLIDDTCYLEVEENFWITADYHYKRSSTNPTKIR